MKRHINTLVLSVTAIIIVLLLTGTFLNRNKPSQKIFVTGLGSKDFKSDLIVWTGSFSKQSKELSTAYDQIKKDQVIIEDYLSDKGVNRDEIAFSAVSINKEFESIYHEGKYVRQEFSGYRLSQYVTIESYNVDEIEQLSRDITEIINEGVEFYSNAPNYYYTKLAELKIEMVAAATEDARVRAEQIADKSKAYLGDLKHAQMGIFQIIAQNSNDDYSWGGTYNTSSKMKSATITMRLQFGID